MSEQISLEREVSRTVRMPEWVWRRIRSKAGMEGMSASRWMALQLEESIQAAESEKRPG